MNTSYIKRLKIKQKAFICALLIAVIALSYRNHVVVQLWFVLSVITFKLVIQILIRCIKLKRYNRLEILDGMSYNTRGNSRVNVQQIRNLLIQEFGGRPIMQTPTGRDYQVVLSINEIPEEAECSYRDGLLREDFRPGEVVRCNRCGALHHRDCFERWGCGSLMCGTERPATLG